MRHNPTIGRIGITRAWCAPGVAIAVLEFAVLVDRCIRAISAADDMHPFTGGDGLLKMAPYALSTRQIEQVKADAIRSRRIVCGLLVIHPQDPFTLSGFTLAHPMNVACALRPRERQDIRSDPR